MPAIDPYKCLPPELTVQSVDDILYRIGLSFDSLKDRPKRRKFFNPFLKFSFLSMYLLREVIIISMKEENDISLKIMGSFGYLLVVRQHMSMALILATSLALSTQTVFFNNHLNGIKQTYLGVLQMISGSVPPIRLGLTNEQQIRKLVKITKFCSIGVEFNNNRVFPGVALMVIIIIYSVECSPMEALLFGLPNALILMTWAIYVVGVIDNLFVIFLITCLYLKMEINSLNESLIEMKRRKRFIRIRETLQSFDSLYSKITEYDRNLWSKILFCFWLILGTMNVFNLYVCLFISMTIILKLIFFYNLFFWSSCFLFIIFMTSSVTYCANKSYKTLNSLIISYSKQPKNINYCHSVSNNLKVIKQ